MNLPWQLPLNQRLGRGACLIVALDDPSPEKESLIRRTLHAAAPHHIARSVSEPLAFFGAA